MLTFLPDIWGLLVKDPIDLLPNWLSAEFRKLLVILLPKYLPLPTFNLLRAVLISNSESDLLVELEDISLSFVLELG